MLPRRPLFAWPSIIFWLNSLMTRPTIKSFAPGTWGVPPFRVNGDGALAGHPDNAWTVVDDAGQDVDETRVTVGLAQPRSLCWCSIMTRKFGITPMRSLAGFALAVFDASSLKMDRSPPATQARRRPT